MSLDRISKLENLGFEWELRGTKKSQIQSLTEVDGAANFGSMNQFNPFLWNDILDTKNKKKGNTKKKKDYLQITHEIYTVKSARLTKRKSKCNSY